MGKSRLLALIGVDDPRLKIIARDATRKTWKSTKAIDVRVADAIESEVDSIIDLVKRPISEGAQVTMIVNSTGCSYRQAEHMHDVLWKEVNVTGTMNAAVHTPRIMEALHYWDEVRQSNDEDYWVYKLRRSIVQHLDKGNSVYVTDVRTVKELKLIKNLGGSVIALIMGDDHNVPQELRSLPDKTIDVTGLDDGAIVDKVSEELSGGSRKDLFMS